MTYSVSSGTLNTTIRYLYFQFKFYEPTFLKLFEKPSDSHLMFKTLCGLVSEECGHLTHLCVLPH